MAEFMNYDKSPAPPGETGGVADRSIGTDARGNWVYPSLVAAGMVEVELPTLPGSSNPTESFHARDFGRHVIGRIEASMNGSGYLKSGSQQNPAEVLAHYVATARGAKLLDEGTLDYMARLSREFSGQKGESRQTYYTTMVRPYLLSLTPKQRPK